MLIDMPMLRSSAILAPMKSIMITALLAFPSYGFVESVREVQLAEPPPAFVGVFALAARPPSGDELLVRLDDGQAISVVQTGMQLFQPGQRVRVAPESTGVRVEHAGGYPPFQP